MLEPTGLPVAERRVLFVGWVNFPFGSAASSRIRHMAMGLERCGVSTHVLTTRRIGRRECDLRSSGHLAYGSTTYETTNIVDTGHSKAQARRAVDLLKATQQAWRRTESLLRSDSVIAVILYSRSFFQCQPVIRLCRKYEIPVLTDAVEWYLPRVMPYFLRTGDHYLGMRVSHRMLDGAIVISSFLERKYQDWGVPTLLVPSIIDTSRISETSQQLLSKKREVLNVVYVGQFKPDEAVGDLLSGIGLARERGCPVELHIVGNDGSMGRGRQVRERVAASSWLNGHVHFLGWVPEEEYRRTLYEADALVLLRNATIRARASFPTRLPEFLGTGKPLITNDVPDIPYYVSDRKHAHVVAAGRPDLIANRIEEIFYDPETSKRIGEAGRERIQECFDYKKHAERIDQFIRQVSGRP